MPQLFGEKLRNARLKRNMTQADLAQRLGLASHAHIAKLEGDQDVPSLNLVIRAAEALSISTDYFLRDALPVEPLVPSVNDVADKDGTPSYGARLRALRLQHNISQTDLARQLGISRAYISNQEAGRKAPSLDLVVQIADHFGVTTDSLLHSAELTERGAQM